MIQLLFEEGIISEQKFFKKLKIVQAQYQKRDESDKHPQSLIDALVTEIIGGFSLEEKITVTNLDEEELRVLELVLGRYMNFSLGRFNEKGNERLLKECRARSNDESLDDTGATVFILKEIWKRLRETHRLRAVK